ncbi:lactococcin 972 family bacteriocin [Streptomyces longwoodensis]|uniref:lactococcin 972 family bacteriocin n=1 Tax=Streptomyces longwoodensis TaxID=68231 RepID=UPI00340FD19A
MVVPHDPARPRRGLQRPALRHLGPRLRSLATTVNVGGGTWSYDEGASTAWSNYKHPQNDHASSVQTGETLTRSGCTAPGKWSLASRAKTGRGVSYYYNPSC